MQENKTALASPTRIALLRRLALLDSATEESFDRLTRLANQSRQVPVSLVSLVDDKRQFFKSQKGLPEPWRSCRETPLSHSFCQYLVVTQEPLVITDARQHPMLKDNRAIDELGVIAYAGIPLITSDGHVLGSFCAIDTQPRRWSERELVILKDLAAITMTEIERRLELLQRRTLVRILAERNREFKTLADALPVLLAYLDTDERYRFVNASYARHLARRPDELLGRRQREVMAAEGYHRIAPYNRAALAGEVVRLELAGAELQQWLATIAPRGEKGALSAASMPPIQALEVQWIPQRGAQHQVIGFYILAIDISERQRLELHRLQASKLEMLGQISGRVAHDFNNLLQIVRGNLELLELSLQEGMEEQALVEDALSAVNSGAELIKQLRAMANQNASRQQWIDLPRFLKKLTRRVRPLLQRRARLCCEVEGELRPYLDPNQLEGVLLNLLINARDALVEDGQVTIIARGCSHIEALQQDGLTLPPDEYLYLAVVDNGIGMNQAIQERALEPFFTTKGKYGTGLGLSSVQQFVQAAGGEMCLTSQLGKGTCVALYLPLEPPAVTEETSEALTSEEHYELCDSAASPAKLTILVVEDRDSVLDYINRILARLGYRVYRAANADQAQQLLIYHDVQLVISDIMMPGSMDGVQLKRWIHHQMPHIPVILMTGYSEHQQSLDGLLLQKPFSQRKLTAMIHKALHYT